MNQYDTKVGEHQIKAALEKRHSRDKIWFEVNCRDEDGKTRRFDAWTMPHSWSSEYTGYEIKVSRNDFVNDNKWHEEYEVFIWEIRKKKKGLMKHPKTGYFNLNGEKVAFSSLKNKKGDVFANEVYVENRKNPIRYEIFEES